MNNIRVSQRRPRTAGENARLLRERWCLFFGSEQSNYHKRADRAENPTLSSEDQFQNHSIAHFLSTTNRPAGCERSPTHTVVSLGMTYSLQTVHLPRQQLRKGNPPTYGGQNLKTPSKKEALYLEHSTNQRTRSCLLYTGKAAQR